MIRTDLPDGTYSRVDRTPWLEEQRALTLTQAHAATPTKTHLDTLGRAFLFVTHDKLGSADDFHETRSTLDLEGHVLDVKDPLGRTCQTHTWSLVGKLLRDVTIDKGTFFHTVDGALSHRWDPRQQVFRNSFDVLRRPANLTVKPGAAGGLLQRTVSGDSPGTGITNPATNNLRGSPIRVFDGAGRIKSDSYDFKGNSIRGAATDIPFVADIDYDAKGQRTEITDSTCNLETAYTNDPLTFQQQRVLSTRLPSSQTLQDLNYTFDPVGNIVEVVDDAQDSHFFGANFVSPSARCEHDDETGLYAMGARYYAAWLGRWTSADPLGIGADGPGVYNYTRGSPVVYVDPGGMQGGLWDQIGSVGQSIGRGLASAGTKALDVAAETSTYIQDHTHYEREPAPDTIFPYAIRTEDVGALHGEVEAEIHQNTKEWQDLFQAYSRGQEAGSPWGIPGRFWDFEAILEPVEGMEKRLSKLDALVAEGLARKDEDNFYQSTVRDRAEAAGLLEDGGAEVFDDAARGARADRLSAWALGRIREGVAAMLPGEGAGTGLLAKDPTLAGAAAKLAGKVDPSLCKLHRCIEFADALEAKLVAKGIPGTRTRVEVGPNISVYSEELKITLGEKGSPHEFIQVEGTVFDNMRSKGWASDRFFEDIGMKDIEMLEKLGMARVTRRDF